jgi:Protein of unknown function (DUF1549)/Protein of unknown function (DUF1553)/Planctomycete cytochrome C
MSFVLLRRIWCLLILFSAISTRGVSAAGEGPDFDKQVAPILANRCLECHSGAEPKGKLDLSRAKSAFSGGESGAAIVRSRPDESYLWQRISADEMPPKHPLPAGEREILRAWIAVGANWGTDPIDRFRYTTAERAGFDWWSLQPLQPIEPPPVANAQWRVNPIDRFILHNLEAAGLRPSPEADRRTLIRRLSFDLLGLPPTPEDVQAFVEDKSPRAYERLVDRLLDSPHYGERWARHWLDIIRFGETQGFERNKFRPSAWKYRDFVVEAFNGDLPYDEFIRWQIAGDVLRPDEPLAVVASGFLAMGPYDLTAYNNGTADMRAFAREEELEGLVATVCQAFLGLTVNCSRCHDHKFDPVTQKEFYQISAALGGTYQGEERESLTMAARPVVAERIAALRTEIDAMAAREHSTDLSQLEFIARRSRMENLAAIFYGGPVHTTTPRQPGPWKVLARGDFKQPGDTVSPRGIAAVAGANADWGLAADAPEAERRKALANWIADPKNPLTPRVIVNRLWGYHFGDGVVRTPSDFGFQGGLPSHPELLNWLAGQLVRPADGHAWSLKRIQRLIVLSATYRQQSRVVRESAAVDRDNRLVWHRPSQRLDAETFRDAVLSVSGELDPRVGGPGFEDFTVSSKGNNETYTVFDAVGNSFNRRSLYRACVRAGTSPLLDTLDCPDPSVATPRRSVTTTPLQALSLLNDAFVEHYAERFAVRLKRERPDDQAAQVCRAYELGLARRPTDEELAFGRQFVERHGLTQFCLVLFNASEFLYID